MYGVHQRDVVPICTSDHPTVALLGFIKCFAAGILAGSFDSRSNMSAGAAMRWSMSKSVDPPVCRGRAGREAGTFGILAKC